MQSTGNLKDYRASSLSDPESQPPPSLPDSAAEAASGGIKAIADNVISIDDVGTRQGRVMDSPPAAAVAAWHCENDVQFRSVEAARREVNAKTAQTHVFYSHCWRDHSTQLKKRRIAASLSLPVEVRA